MATNENGLTAGNSQPVKTLTKRTADFMAVTDCFTSVNNGLNMLLLVLDLQFVAIVLGGLR